MVFRPLIMNVFNGFGQNQNLFGQNHTKFKIISYTFGSLTKTKQFAYALDYIQNAGIGYNKL